MHEQVLNFGPSNGLIGILTEPAQPSAGATAVILLNAGLLHRVGPNRMHVDVARRLAADGYSVLRFDMSGIGDSEMLDDSTLDIERSRSDVVHAMDVLAERGAEDFVLMGLCTGAYNAFRTALVDQRVAGCVLIDGYSYPTLKSRLLHYRGRILELDRWVSFFRRRISGGVSDGETPADDLIVFENEVVSQERFATDLGHLIERDVAMLMVYTGLGPLTFNYERQMHDAFPSLDLDRNVTVSYYPDADHTFRLPGNRLRLIEDLAGWLVTAIPEPRIPAGKDR